MVDDAKCLRFKNNVTDSDNINSPLPLKEEKEEGVWIEEQQTDYNREMEKEADKQNDSPAGVLPDVASCNLDVHMFKKNGASPDKNS